jgi:hypothetical protein
MDAFKKFGEAMEEATKEGFADDKIGGYINQYANLLEGSGFTQ